MLRWLGLSLLTFFPMLAQADIRVAITVDDLPVHGPLPPGTSRLTIANEMLSAFEAAGLKGIYGFINAGNLPAHPGSEEILRRWIAAGQRLGNHTFDHADLNSVTTEEFLTQITKNEDALRINSREKDWRVFRYPFLHEGNSLDKRKAVRAFLKNNGYRIAPVSVPFQDYAWNEPYARCLAAHDEGAQKWLRKSFMESAVAGIKHADQLARKLYGHAIPQVLLLHLGVFEAAVTVDLINRLKKEGVRIVPLEEALSNKSYADDPGLPFENGGFFLSQVARARGLDTARLGLRPLDNFPEKRLREECR